MAFWTREPVILVLPQLARSEGEVVNVGNRGGQTHQDLRTYNTRNNTKIILESKSLAKVSMVKQLICEYAVCKNKEDCSVCGIPRKSSFKTLQNVMEM